MFHSEDLYDHSPMQILEWFVYDFVIVIAMKIMRSTWKTTFRMKNLV